ncbi:MAG: hypothetical protein ACHQZQ_03910, partial [SAR324 cluster bacterium]
HRHHGRGKPSALARIQGADLGLEVDFHAPNPRLPTRRTAETAPESGPVRFINARPLIRIYPKS